MEECVVCGEKALYRCNSCKALFCEEHKSIHEKTKNKSHILVKLEIHLDPNQSSRITADLISKINKLQEFKNKITLENKALILKIQELYQISLNTAESKEHYYINLLKIAQSVLTAEDLRSLEDQSTILSPLTSLLYP